jgi:hypothetical protein
MVTAFKDMPWDTVGINPREIVTEIPFETSLFRGVHLNGRIDGACGGQIIEHKTTALLNDKYYEHLAYDDQITFYLTAFSLMKKTPKTSVVYTIIQKPSIRQKQNETEEEYIQRVKEWYSDNRDKVSIVRVARTKEQLAESYKEIREIASDMRTRTNFYRNPSHCLHLPCEYNSICLNYSPEILINFKREEEKHNGRREQSKDFNND